MRLPQTPRPAAESMQPIDLDRHCGRCIAPPRPSSTISEPSSGASSTTSTRSNRTPEDGTKGWRSSRSSSFPRPILERARSIDAKAERAIARVREYRDALLPLFDRAVALQARIDDARALITVQWDRVRAQRLQLQEFPLWQLGAAHAQFPLIAAELRSAWSVLHDYLTLESPGLAGVFLGDPGALRLALHRRSEQAEGSAPRAYGRPVAASLLIALMSLWWLAPDPPVLFYEALLVLVPLPAAMVARRALPAPIPLTLYGLALATMLLVCAARSTRARLPIGCCCCCRWRASWCRSPSTCATGRLQPALRRVSPGIVRAAALVVLVASAVTVFNVIFGFAGPTRPLRAGMGSILGFGLVFGATGVALYGAALALLATPIVRNGSGARATRIRRCCVPCVWSSPCSRSVG